jgi:hypothetical protein
MSSRSRTRERARERERVSERGGREEDEREHEWGGREQSITADIKEGKFRELRRVGVRKAEKRASNVNVKRKVKVGK